MIELDLIEKICRGIDPATGEMLDTPKDPALDKARLAYLAKLRSVARKSMTVTTPAVSARNKWKPWLKSDDDALTAAWKASPSLTVEQLAERFGRSGGAIEARLAHLKLYATRDDVRVANKLRGSI